MIRQRRSHWSSTVLCEKEVKVDVIEELLKEDEEDEKDTGIQSAGCLRYGSR